jgi:hypothetical protein
MARMVQSQPRFYGNAPGPVYYTPPPEASVWCPVCKVEYPQSQTDAHILKHTMRNIVYA